MTIQVILTFGLALIILYGFVQRDISKIVSRLIIATGSVGVYLVWLPDHTTVLARMMGVTRGADLLFYCWILISMFLIINLHAKSRMNLRLITELTRQAALANPKIPPNPTVDKSDNSS